MEAAKDEIRLLQAIAANDPDDNHAVLHLVDSFELTGPNGTRLNFTQLFLCLFIYIVISYINS